MSPSSIPNQGNFFNPQLLDFDDPNVEGIEFGDELHAFTCLCRICAAKYDRIDRLLRG